MPATLALPVLSPPRPRATPAGRGDHSGPRSISAVRMLRISITDRCNLRCVYCMPADGVPWLPSAQLLTRGEIVEVVRAASEIHDIRHIKLTGGEPTVRPDLLEIIDGIRTVPGVEDLSLTTNGMLLPELARPLKHAGLDRVTVSIDSLRPDRFRRITRNGDLGRVLAGLDAADSAGFEGTKINCVTMRGTNDDELVEFARLTLDRRLTVRFIEYMPIGETGLPPCGAASPDEAGAAAGCGAQDRGGGASVFVGEAEARRRIEDALGPLVPIPREAEPGVGPSSVYRLASTPAGRRPLGRIGFISAMSAPFCDTCNRLRLTADGRLRSCLFDGGEVDLKPILRSTRPGEARAAALAARMARCAALKPVTHCGTSRDAMSRIGG